MAQPDPPTRIGLEQALEIVAARAAMHRLAAETVPLADAQGRVLAEDVRVTHPLPPFDNSAMDGFALRGADLPDAGERTFVLIGEVLAGAASAPDVGAGECVRITAGAPMPPGADTVVIKENVAVDGDRVTVGAGEKAGANVRVAGEDYAEGDPAFAAGTPLDAVRLAVLAASGIAQVVARRRARVAIVATGNELVPAGQPLGFGQIHESNAVMLAALAREAGAHVVMQRCMPDEPRALQAALLEAAADADIIVTSGGVSAGEADHLPDVLRAIGEIHFHKVRLKPGMPTLFGQIGASLYFGLPGNPVASAVTFRVFVRFALRAMLGITVVPEAGRARLAVPLHKRHARAELLRCKLHVDGNGVPWATPHAKQGSGMLRGLVETDALALLPEGEKEYRRGDVVVLWPESGAIMQA
jgi:molybdopterin molybdotransferase